jgi:15-cis-phytoene synthase
MSARELDAAGIHDPLLRASYTRNRALLAEHGRTYYLAALLLPPAKRPYVHAVYGFARYVDELADRTDTGGDERSETLRQWTDAALADLARGRSADPIRHALIDTVRRWDLPHDLFADFIAAMRADQTVTGYQTYPDLERYMYGAAGTLALQLLPILEPTTDAAREPLRVMGSAFQLTNIIRDVAEDLDRGRVYLPAEDLDRFGVARADLGARTAGPAVRELVRFEVARARGLYAQARDGIPLLHPTSRECIHVATVLYGQILDVVEASGHDVLAGRARVATMQRLRVAAPAAVRSWWARARTGPR